jgi:hypothetical protein
VPTLPNSEEWGPCPAPCHISATRVSAFLSDQLLPRISSLNTCEATTRLVPEGFRKYLLSTFVDITAARSIGLWSL